MPVPSRLYRPSLALLTDFYELTMACAAFRSGAASQQATFTLSFRRHPFQGGFTVAAGLAPAIDFIEHLHFEPDDVEFLSAQVGADGHPLFDRPFLEALGALRMDVDVDAVPEGTVVFPQEPVLRVSGPVIPGLLLESALLALINFQTLVATKAARVVLAAGDAPVLEFGMRRAQGIDGAISASRAAYLGGCAATSNTLAGKLYGIPVRGTHAHAWVMLHHDELSAFEAYARAQPGNCVFLVDTYRTLDGVRHAIQAGRALRAAGHELLGIRLDSGDLAWLSQEARRLLDEAGFEGAAIYASNELDEHIIQSLRDQGARIAVWGVGTRLVTGAEDGALGGVYKLSSVRAGPGEAWQPRLKVSDAPGKTTVPGRLQVRRFGTDRGALADAIYDEDLGLPALPTIVDPLDATRRREIAAGTPGEDLLVPIFRAGDRVYEPPPLAHSRARTATQLAAFHAGVKRFVFPHQFPVGLERRLHDLRTELVLAGRRGSAEAST
jgi:nicotinate phosphoribosyltransferase